MPAAETAKLLAELNLGGNFNREADKAIGKVGKLEGTLDRIGGHASRGLRTAAGNLAKIGAVAIGGIGLAVKTGLDDLAALENATTSVDGAIKQMGLTGQVTSGQVAQWANEIESNVGAAFDDKDITAATEGLIRYGKLVPRNIRPAMEVMTDLAARVGSVETAGELLAKALADPTRAAGKLSRYGIILTKVQQDQIKAMAEAGDVAGAQALILDELSKSTTGAAAASQGPYRRAISLLADVSEDARKALAEGFLPVIEKVGSLLSKELAKPQTIQNIREFGQTLAGGLDRLIDIARGLPWGTIGDSLRLAGSGAKIVLDAFTSLPPWVQTAVLTGWGLNKLTGGALGGIVGELGKGLIKGVLGMNAAVVNINAGVVNGGVPGVGGAGAAGAAGAAKTGLSALGKVFLVGEAIGLAAAVVGVQQAVSGGNTEIAREVKATGERFVSENKLSNGQLEKAIAAVDTGIAQIKSNPLNILVQGDALTELQQTKANLQRQLELQRGGLAEQRTGERDIKAGLATVSSATSRHSERITSKLEAGLEAQRAGERTMGAGLDKVKASTDTVQQGIAIQQGIQRIADAKRAVEAFQLQSAQLRTQGSVERAKASVDTARSAIYAIGNQIAAAVFAARPIIQPTTVVRVAAGSSVYSRTASRHQGRIPS